MQSARFIDSTVTIMYYGTRPPYYGGEHITLDNETEQADYSQVHIFRLQKDEWKDLDEVTLPYIGVVKKQPVQPRRRLVAMTMFKDDYRLIPGYVRYYKELGVEHFFMYYNKRMGSDPLPDLPDVTYIEWDYPYYNQEYGHWAQITAINDFLYWAKHFADYVLFNDLDEFIQVPLDLTGDKLCYGFTNRFVTLDDPSQTGDIKNKKIKLFDWSNDFPRKSKCIVSTRQVVTMGVHQPNIPRYNEENTKILGEFFHVSNFEDRTRVTGLEK